MTADSSPRLALSPRYQSTRVFYRTLLNSPFPERHVPFGFTMRYPSYLIVTPSGMLSGSGVCILSLPPTGSLVGTLSYVSMICVWRCERLWMLIHSNPAIYSVCQSTAFHGLFISQPPNLWTSRRTDTFHQLPIFRPNAPTPFFEQSILLTLTGKGLFALGYRYGTWARMKFQRMTTNSKKWFALYKS